MTFQPEKDTAELRFKIGDIVRFTAEYRAQNGSFCDGDFVVVGFIRGYNRVELRRHRNHVRDMYICQDEIDLMPTGREDSEAVGPPVPRVCVKCGLQRNSWARRWTPGVCECA